MDLPVDTAGQVALTSRRRRPAATSSRKASFSAFASASSFVYLASRAATSRWRTSISLIVSFASVRL
ncbi:hypothetical protein LEO97_09395 [Salmonella enterica]|nr:hypothetical protein [Salmonella enterica]MCC4830791.1 hypothetical protein [Salmonella enterica subsp. enterica serovar Typhimurium]MCA5624749.1 hypothetical protein [Salmonella enterica]MCA5628254.1 hypothetical protein [Salmonella enterica]MCA5634035.1 hypothetical protein [Salmonella enterica]